jgi:glutamate 5-kinase
VQALLSDKSLLAPGIRKVEGSFHRGDAVEIVGPDGTVCGKGTVRLDASQIDGGVGRGVAVHKDDLIILDLS